MEDYPIPEALYHFTTRLVRNRKYKKHLLVDREDVTCEDIAQEVFKKFDMIILVAEEKPKPEYVYLSGNISEMTLQEIISSPIIKVE